MYCRGRELLSGAYTESAAPTDGPTAGGAIPPALARQVGEGMLAELSGALGRAQLDPRVYELNSALAVALDAPFASRRWASGEPIFAGCTTLNVPQI